MKDKIWKVHQSHNFNSIKVQLEHKNSPYLSIFRLYFNSIKVQLERYEGQRNKAK